MPRRLPHFTCFLLVALLFSGCATTWSEHDRAQLKAVDVAPVQVAKAAYQKPDATDSPGMTNSIPTVTGGGLIPSLIGSAIDATVMAKQQKKFEAGNAQHFEALAARMTAPPSAELEAALRQELAGHEFFGPRLSPGAPARFTTEILGYGLQKSPLSQKDDILLRVRIIARIELVLPDKKVLLRTQITGVASTAAHAEDIVADPEFIAKGTAEAVKDLAWQLSVLMAPKLKITKLPERYN